MPYLRLLIQSADFPSVDYDSKKEKTKEPKTKEEEILAMNAIFK